MERLMKTGVVKPKHSSEIHHSRIGIGFEKLDRDVFDPEKAYDKIANTGVKWVRIQSGWQKTEKVKGQYNFEWLDKIVDNLLKRGMKPWMCLCYGNQLYDDMAKTVFGAVGCPPIYTEEARNAWSAYVSALAEHFKGRIEYYEVWNEPDGKWCWKNGVNAKEYGEFVIATAKAIRQADSSAKVVGGAVCHWDMHYLYEALMTGMKEHIDAISYHMYTPKDIQRFERFYSIKGLCQALNLDVEIIQGESGSQSRSDGAGALKGCSWTPRKQAKQLARQIMIDLMTDVKFTSYFSSMDMIEALNGIVGDKSSYLDYGYFGVLAATFDEDGFATGDYTPKMSYTTLQTICSVFADDFTVTEFPVLPVQAESRRVFGRDMDTTSLIKGGFKKPNGSFALVYWNSCDLLTTEFESTITFNIVGIPGKVQLVDLLTGTIYDIPESIMKETSSNCYIFENLPVTDYPLLLTFGDFI